MWALLPIGGGLRVAAQLQNSVVVVVDVDGESKISQVQIDTEKTCQKI
jgi:hypothetical protein